MFYQDGRCNIATPVKAGFFKHAVRCWYSHAGCSGEQRSPMPFILQDSEAADSPHSSPVQAIRSSLSLQSPVSGAGWLSSTTLFHSLSWCCLCLKLLVNTNITCGISTGFCVSQELNSALELLRDAHSKAGLEVQSTHTHLSDPVNKQ